MRIKISPTDKFRIVFDTVEAKVGKMLKLLSEQGGNVVSCNIITDIPTYQKNSEGRRIRRPDGAAEQFHQLVLKRLQKGPATLKEFMALSAQNNLNPNTASQNLTSLLNDGKIDRISVGLYALKPAKPTTKPATKPKAKPKSKKPARKHGARAVIISLLQKKSSPTGPIARKLVKQGFGEHTASSALSDMKKQGQIIQKDGTYSLPTNGPATE